MTKKIFFLLVFVPGICSLEAGTSDSLRAAEERLAETAKQILHAPKLEKRVEAEVKFREELEKVLHIEGAYEYPFEKLETISRLRSPDNRFRIFSWQVMPEPSKFYHGGMLMLKNGNEVRIIPLRDKADSIPQPQMSMLTPDKWYGCLYYDIIKTSKGKKDYYTLLGYNANDPVIKEKVIDVLTFEDDMSFVRFGETIFNTPKWQHRKLERPPFRLLLRYSAKRSASVKWREKDDMILMDHLSPQDASMQKFYQFYGPDFSYDALRWDDGQWQLETDVKFKSDIEAPVRPPDKPTDLPSKKRRDSGALR